VTDPDPTALTYPKARASDHVDILHGVSVPDPFAPTCASCVRQMRYTASCTFFRRIYAVCFCREPTQTTDSGGALS